MSKLKQLLLVAILAGTAMTVARNAEAAGYYGQGYLCYVDYDPRGGCGDGPLGNVGIGVYSGPGCSGTYLGAGALLNTGATVGYSYSYFKDAPLMTMLNVLQQALIFSRKIFVNIYDIPNACNGQVGYIYFY
jgi:hypothetical protein